jgi:hypothetical protein
MLAMWLDVADLSDDRARAASALATSTPDHGLYAAMIAHYLVHQGRRKRRSSRQRPRRAPCGPPAGRSRPAACLCRDCAKRFDDAVARVGRRTHMNVREEGSHVASPTLGSVRKSACLRRVLSSTGKRSSMYASGSFA